MNQSDEAKKLMDLKQKRIAHFQDAKERSMAIMSSGRDAAIITAEILKKLDTNTATDSAYIESMIKKWRKFFFYEIYGTDPDEEVKQHMKETGDPKVILGF